MMRKTILGTSLLAALVAVAPVVRAEPAGDDSPRARMKPAEEGESKEKLADLARASVATYRALAAGDKKLPDTLLKNARCVAVFPQVTKAALVVGGTKGEGMAFCRTSSGAWSKPAFVETAGVSAGVQAGYQKQDLVLFFGSDRAASKLRDGRFTLGTDVSVTAGEYGASFQGIDKALNGVVAYGRKSGAFAGVALTGNTVQPDEENQTAYYGTPKVMSALTTPADRDGSGSAVQEMLSLLPA